MQNQMTATDCIIFTRKMKSEEAVAQKTKLPGMGSAIDQLRTLAALCNAGVFDVTTMQAPLKDRVIQGDATDQAILRFSEGVGSVNEIRRLWRNRFKLAFNSKNKFTIRIFSLSQPKGLTHAVDSNEASSFAQSGDL
jgi:sodium/potassium-transporting ATPase subunit alpha